MKSKSKLKNIFIPNLNQEGTCNNNTIKNEKNDNSNFCYGIKCLEREKTDFLLFH